MSNQSFKTIESTNNKVYSYSSNGYTGAQTGDAIAAITDEQIVIYKIIVSPQEAITVEFKQGTNKIVRFNCSAYTTTVIDFGDTPITLPVTTALVFTIIGGYQTTQINIIYDTIG